MSYTKELVGLIRSLATELPPDVEASLNKAKALEKGVPYQVLATIGENIALAKEKKKPICQDTGTPIFYVSSPPGLDRDEIIEDILSALRQSTLDVPLRPNAVDPLTGCNSNDNTGVNIPVIHFIQWSSNSIKFDLNSIKIIQYL